MAERLLSLIYARWIARSKRAHRRRRCRREPARVNREKHRIEPTARTSPTIVPELDGVRGIAVLLVMLCHAYIIQPVPLPHGIKSLYLSDILYLGWSGVDLFFVLSGFLISGILLDTKDSKHYFVSFYARRLLRIAPLYVIVVFGYFHLVLPIAHHFGRCKALDNALEPWFWLHLSNWRIAFGQQGHWLQHFWSLAIEEQFYLLWPLVVCISGRRRLPYVCIFVGTVSFGLRCIYAHHRFGEFFLYALTPFRIEPLAVGCMAAILVRSGRMLAFAKNGRRLLGTAVCGFLMLCTAVSTARSVSYNTVSMSTYGFTALAIIYVCLVLYAYIYSGSPTWLASQLRIPLLRQLGKYSYAIYVFHMGLFMASSVVVEKVSAILPDRWRFIFWLLALSGTISLTYAVALVSWHLVEKHFWTLKSRFRVQYRSAKHIGKFPINPIPRFGGWDRPGW